MKLHSLITATLLALGAATAAHAVDIQTYGTDEYIWQNLRDDAYKRGGPAGLVEYDREAARRFYGKDHFRTLRDLDIQIRIDRRETDLDTQLRADQIRYGFGRGDGSGSPSPIGATAPLRLGERLPAQYFSRQYMVDDWRGHRLSQPRRGEQWVQVGADYVLVNRNGVIQLMERPR
ncbi:MAG: RcnB family protein [Pseudomonadota bacterium]